MPPDRPGSAPPDRLNVETWKRQKHAGGERPGEIKLAADEADYAPGRVRRCPY